LVGERGHIAESVESDTPSTYVNAEG